MMEVSQRAKKLVPAWYRGVACVSVSLLTWDVDVTVRVLEAAKPGAWYWWGRTFVLGRYAI